MAQARHDLRLRLVFCGECIKGHDPVVVRRAVGAALKLSETRTARLFSGKHIVLKQQVDSVYAARQIARFAAMGAVLRTEQHRPAPKPPEPRKSRLSAVFFGRWPQVRSSPWLIRGLIGGSIGGVALLVLALGAGTMGWSRDEAQAGEPLTGAAAPHLAPAAVPALPAQRVSPSSQVADDGLPRQLSAQATQDYRKQYFPAAWHKAFVVAASGAHVWVVGAASPGQARAGALKQCTQALRAAVADCRVVDVDGEPQD